MKKIFFTILISTGLVFGSSGVVLHNTHASNLSSNTSINHVIRINTVDPHPIG